MFSISRYDPSHQDATDKSQKLASLNNRLKRKRHSEVADIKAPKSSVSAPQADVEQRDHAIIESTFKKPHREKKKNRTEEEVSSDLDSLQPSKVAHIIKKFHKVQDRAARLQTEEKNSEKEVSESTTAEVADLVPIPQPSRSAVKRPVSGTNTGLPHYLQHPNVIQTSLSVPFSSLPLSKKIHDNLNKCEFENAFAVQAALLPILLADCLPEDWQDILVSAPTGSGKTLAYTLPILQKLQSRRITRLRALILVPTRELVQQVQSTFESLSSKLGLKIETLSATRPFVTEQSLLVNDYEPNAPSNVDILICTPGRLVDHLKSTPRFTLRDLRFLVIDEGDRLLNQSFQGWSAEIDEALKPLRCEVEPAEIDIFATKSHERCQKLIFSATMSTDPSLLAQLNLIKPALYLIQDRGVGTDVEDEDLQGEDVISKFTTPSTLLEYFVHAPREVPKPLVLLHVIHRMRTGRALVFTNSNESAQKLTSLISLCNVGRCEAFTSTLTPAMRRRHLSDFSSSTTAAIDFLVCSDLMARGIDTTVSCVINYDSSISTRQYVHRVGRTARAGKKGQAVSIVEKHEDKYWWRQIGGRKIRRSQPIQRVTLFKKTEREHEHKIDEEESQTDDNRSEDEKEEDVPSSDENEGLGDESQDEDDVHKAIVLSTDMGADGKHAIAPIDLAVVDQDALQATYEAALAKLQDRS